MDNQTSLGVRIVDTEPKNFGDVDTATWLKYITQAEDLISKGYLPPNTSVKELAAKLWKINS
jgi:hypothetical protein